MISYYELLGLIKERRHPDKVIYKGSIYTQEDDYYFNLITCSYLTEEISEGNIEDDLINNKNIEIIEDKPKEIEKIEIKGEYYLPSKELCNDYDFKKFVLDDLQSRNKTIEEIRQAVNYLLEEEDKHAN